MIALLECRRPDWLKASLRFTQRVQEEFKDRLAAVYVARHPSIEVDGYNAVVVLRRVEKGDQEKALRIGLEVCSEMSPEDQIAPLVVEEGDPRVEIGEELVLCRRPDWLKASLRFTQRVQEEFKDRLAAVYVARHPSIEVDGYNAVVVLRRVEKGDQEKALRIGLEVCSEMSPEDQIAPLVVEEGDPRVEIGEEFQRKV